MAKGFQTISLKPLTGTFDARSLPSDLVPGNLRWKQNFAITDQGKLWRRDGHQKFLSDAASYTNQDHHFRGADRLPITFLHENTAPDGSRRLFDGDEEGIYLLDETTGLWTQLAGNMGAAGAKWKAASLRNNVVFTNNIVDPPQIYTIGDVTTSDLSNHCGATGGVAGPYLRQALVIIQFSGFIIVMNVGESDNAGGAIVRYASRVRWSDMNRANVWETGNVGGTDSLAGFQDLDYGDEILAAEVLGGNVIIYTARSIWKMYVAAQSVDYVFGFQKLYSDNKNQSGCIAYPDSIVSDGAAHYYMGRDGIYKYSLYSAEPERISWIHDSSAIIYDSLYDSKVDETKCTSPVGYYRSDRKELWFSWPDDTEVGENGNNHTLCCNVQHKTCDYMDTGYTAVCSYTPTSDCKTAPTYFVGCSSVDWALKTIGNVFHRDYYALVGDITDDLLMVNTAYTEGYNSIIRGEIPTGLYDVEKIVRRVAVEHDTVEDATPNNLRLRIGNSAKAADVNAADGKCSVQWRRFDDQDLTCPNDETMTELAAQNLKPDGDTDWAVYEQNYRLYFELSIEGKTGPAQGADTKWSKIDFEVAPLK